MAVAGDGNQLSHPAPPRMIALAVQNEVDSLGSLRTNERVVEIGSGIQSQIRQPIERVPRDFLRGLWKAFRPGLCSWPAAGRSHIRRGLLP